MGTSRAASRPAARTAAPSALFTKKRAAPVPVEEAPQRKAGLFSFGKKAAPAKPAVVETPKKAQLFRFGAKPAAKAAPVVVEKPKNSGLFRAKKPTAKKVEPAQDSKADEYARRQGFGGVLGAFDFAEVRSKGDAELLYDAKYGKLEGGRLTPEQAAALRRKVGGTAKDFWKTSVDVVGEYTDKGYVEEGAASVPALPLLVGVVLALFGTVAYVVSQTS